MMIRSKEKIISRILLCVLVVFVCSGLALTMSTFPLRKSWINKTNNVGLTQLIIMQLTILMMAAMLTWRIIKKKIYPYFWGLIGFILLSLIISEIVFYCISYRLTGYKDLQQRFQNYEINKNYVDLLQTELSCCGIVGHQDYIEWNMTIPMSCRKNFRSNLFHEDGCLRQATMLSSEIGGLDLNIYCWNFLLWFCIYMYTKIADNSKEKMMAPAMGNQNSNATSYTLLPEIP